MRIKLRKIRQGQNMSYRELSKLSGVSLSQIEKIESGYASNPTIKTMWKLAKALRVKIDDLIEP